MYVFSLTINLKEYIIGNYKDPEYHKKYYQQNKDKIKKVSKEWIKENKEYVVNKNNIWVYDNYSEYLYNSAKNRALRSNIEFSITLKDVIIPKYCPYLEVKITNIRSKGRVNTNASLDRIDNTKGYISGNVQVISDKANRMKNDATIQELETFAINVLHRHSTVEIDYE